MLEVPLLVVSVFFVLCYFDLNRKYKQLKSKKNELIFVDKWGHRRHVNLLDFGCPNKHCKLYKIKSKNNIKKRKIYGKQKDRILLKCNKCGHEFSETHGTMYYQKKKPIGVINQVIQYLTEGGEIRKASRLFKVHQVTVLSYLVAASKKAKLINKLHHQMKFEAFQFDELWSFVFKKNKNLKSGEENSKGSFYGFVSYLFKHRFVLDIHNGKRTDEETIQFIKTQKKYMDLSKYVLIMSDGFSSYLTALLKVFGRPSLFKYDKDNEPEIVLPDKLLYGQVIKKREKGVVVDLIYQVINGGETMINKMLINLNCKKITTSLIERVNLSIRHQVGRFKRKGMGFSKCKVNHEAALDLFQAVYNYATPHRSLNNKSPAMSIGISNRIWTIEDILTYQVAS